MNQYADAFNGVVGAGKRLQLTQFNSSTEPVVLIRNLDASVGPALEIRDEDDNVVFSVDRTGVNFVGEVTGVSAIAGGTDPPDWGGFQVDNTGMTRFGVAGPSSNVLMSAQTDESFSHHTVFFDMTDRGLNDDSATFKVVARTGGTMAGAPLTGQNPANISTIDAFLACGTNADIAVNTGRGRHVGTFGLATQTARLDPSGTWASEQCGLYVINQGTGWFTGGTGGGALNGVRANAAIYLGGTQGWEWGIFHQDGSGALLLATDQNGKIGVRTVPSSPLTIKQPADNATDGIASIRSGGSEASYLHTGSDSKSYLRNSAGGRIVLGSPTTDVALEVQGITSLTGDLLRLTIQGGASVLSITAAGVINFTNSANLQSGSGGAAATTGNVSTDPNTGPTTAAATTWVKIQANGAVRWLRAWS